MLRPALAALTSAAAVVPLLVAGPLTSGQAGTYDTGRVTKVVDGDTVIVDHRAVVRLIGIDTPEHGQCGYDAATRALRRLVGGEQVVLRSDTGRSGLRGRPERRVLVKSGGQQVDATTWLLERGMGVWMPRKGEVTNSKAHHRAADLAAAADTGWFDEDRCGAGPGPEGALQMTVQWNADATKALSDAQRRNEEFIRIRNVSTVPVDIDGWTLRVGNDRSRKVPAGGAIPPGGTVTVHVGYGTNTFTDRYLGSSAPMLQNADQSGRRHLGAGAYLVDPRGDMRAYMTWPCVVGCTDPTGGAVHISEVLVDPGGPLNGEYVAITNSGPSQVRSGDLVVEIWPWVYELPSDHVLDPGETVVIHGGSGRNERLRRFLGAVNPPLRTLGGQVVLRTYDAILLDCHRWGGGRCPTYG